MNKDDDFTKINNFLRNYSNSSLYGLIFDPAGLWLQFQFSFNPNEEKVIIKLYNIIILKFSRSLESLDGIFYVGEIKLNRIIDGGENIFKSIAYPFRDKDGQILTYGSQSLFHFHIEGDAVIDVICVGYDIFYEKTFVNPI